MEGGIIKVVPTFLDDMINSNTVKCNCFILIYSQNYLNISWAWKRKTRKHAEYKKNAYLGEIPKNIGILLWTFFVIFVDEPPVLSLILLKIFFYLIRLLNPIYFFILIVTLIIWRIAYQFSIFFSLSLLIAKSFWTNIFIFITILII